MGALIGSLPAALGHGPASGRRRAVYVTRGEQLVLEALRRRARNRPRTPQHKGAAERGMRKLKWSSGPRSSGRVKSARAGRSRHLRVARSIDSHRLRCTRGWKIAVEVDRSAPHWSRYTTRAGFLEYVTCALLVALLDCTLRAARRRATREAILATLEELSIITRTRGGRSRSAQ